MKLAKKLTAKALRIAVKRHATTSVLMEEYGFSSEEELFEAIRKIFTQKSESNRVISDLKKNGKKSITPSYEEHPAEITLVCEPEKMDTTIQLETIELPEQTHNSDFLASLVAEEQELSAKLIGLETNHKRLVASHLTSKENLLRMQRILEEINRLMDEHRKNLSNELDKIQATSNEMATVSQEMKTVSLRLREIRAKIEECKKVSIFVYSTGLLEIENGEIPASVSSEDALNSKFMELIQWPRVKELSVTLKELTTVAKLLLWTEYLASSGLAFEISFDSEEVQRFYEAVSTPTAPA